MQHIIQAPNLVTSSSAKEIMFFAGVGWVVCLCVSNITQNVVNGFDEISIDKSEITELFRFGSDLEY